MKTENKYVKYKRIVAIKEMSAGNAEVGSMWLETKSFDCDTPVKHIMDWAKDCSGKLILTWDEDGKEEDNSLPF